MTDDVAAERPRTLVADRVYGAIAVIAVLLALFFLFRGGETDTTVVDRPPPLTVREPLSGAELAQPVAVTFDARTPLRPDGSNPAATRHVHLRIGATELMPGPTDVQPVSGTTYRWTLPRLPSGPAWLRLYWSDAQHRPIPGAESDSVSVIIR